jgi:hypothetical protein
VQNGLHRMGEGDEYPYSALADASYYWVLERLKSITIHVMGLKPLLVQPVKIIAIVVHPMMK